MNEHESVPNIRFNGFDDDWKEKKFNTLVNRKSHITSNTSLNSIEYENISPDNHGICKNFNNKKGIYFQKGDILFGKLRPYLKKYVLTSYEGKAVGDFWVLSPKKGVYSKFAFYLIQTHKFYLVSNLSSGTKMPRSDWNLVNNSFFCVCNIEEQQKIGYLFTKLDKLLDLQKQKIEKLELLKKSLLQKLFPKHDTKIPELRFKVYKDNWESKKFKNILNYERPDKYIVKSDNYSNNGIPVLTANKSFILGYTQEPNFYEKSLPVIIFDDFTLDCKLVNFPFKIKSSAIKILSPNNFSDIWFDFYLLKVTYFIKEGHARHYISIVQSKITNVPGKAEQQKIGNLLSKVDQLIELENKKLKNLQQFKKCLLQNMFVD